MIDIICRDTKRFEFEKWSEMYEEELYEIYSIEGADLEGQEYDQWKEDFYDAGGTI